jgi:hypothetical protein
MKKLFWVLALVSFVFALPIYANAGIIGTVTLQEAYSSPSGQTSIGNVYFDYDVSINGGSFQEAFCVENRNGPSGTVNYTLLSVDSGLSAFGLNPAKYLQAAAIAEYYYNNYLNNDPTEAWKAGAQIAVWESIFDSSFNLSTGVFSTALYTSQAQSIWTAVQGNIPGSSPWVLAVNPTVAQGGTVIEAEYQNYLVRVPEPTTMLLFGLGLVGLAGLRRKE